MKKKSILLSLAVLMALAIGCHKAEPIAEATYDERLSGGSATVFDESSRAFTHPVDGLGERDAYIHGLGDAAFEQTFVAAPAPIGGGLGPLFNNVSCISCHHNDGKGTPTAGAVTSSLLFRMSLNGYDEFGGPDPVPGYGGQLQDRALLGKTPEASVQIGYAPLTVHYPDGTAAELRQPSYTVAQSYAGLPAGCVLSPRLAPPVFGLGLLELVPDATLLALSDEGDADGDGISGRPNYAYNPVTKQTVIGRFGLKATVPTLELQVASAYKEDMGLTNRIFSRESCFGQPQADALTDDPELPDSLLNAVIFYVRTLAVPARRGTDQPAVAQGGQLFAQLNCSGCHRATLQTDVSLVYPWLSNQRIHPYTDLLLHDLGAGLADGRRDYRASGSEWRTPPLWGIGLFEKTNGTPYYLHDGRARSLEEAILWHGGEAQNARDAFTRLSKSDRDAVLAFLKSL